MTASRLDAKAVQAKLKELNGNMAAVGRHFGVDRSTVLRFCANRPKLQQVMVDCRESRIDVAESALDRAVLNGEGWAIGLTLKTLGKGRGYGDSLELTGDSARPIHVTFVNVQRAELTVERNGHASPDNALPQG